MWYTGIFWRNDKISDDIASMANPYDIFWNGAPKDKTHLLANAQDVLAMPMFRDGMTDVNVTDPATITKAKDDVAQVVECDQRLRSTTSITPTCRRARPSCTSRGRAT